MKTTAVDGPDLPEFVDAGEAGRIIEKLRRVSNGNPGVALATRERSVEDGEIAPGHVAAPEADLDDDEALLLWNVVAMESVGTDLLAGVVGGLVVVLEQPFQVGDEVTLGGHYGEVADVGIRSTTLVTPTDTLVVVPNFLLFNESIASANTGNAEVLVVVEFFVDPDADVRRAVGMVEDAMATSRYVYVSEDHPVEVEIEDDLYYRTPSGRAYVNDLRNEKRFRTDVSERARAAFDDGGIESPKVRAGVDTADREAWPSLWT